MKYCVLQAAASGCLRGCSDPSRAKGRATQGPHLSYGGWEGAGDKGGRRRALGEVGLLLTLLSLSSPLMTGS